MFEKKNLWQRIKMAAWLLFSNQPLIELYKTGFTDGANNTVKDFCKIKQTLVPLLQELTFPSMCEHMIAPPDSKEFTLTQPVIPTSVLHNIARDVPEETVKVEILHYEGKVLNCMVQENEVLRQMMDATRLSSYIEAQKRNAAANLARILIDEGFMVTRKMATLNPTEVCVSYQVLTYNKV